MNRRSWVAHLVALLILGALTVGAIARFHYGTLVDNIPFLLMLTVTLVVGWVLAWKRPANPLGWLLLAVPGLFVIQVPLTLLGLALQPAAPDAAAWIFWFAYDREDTWSWLPPVGLLFTQIPLRFPDGRLPSPRWRWFSAYTIVSLVIGSAVLSTISADVAPGVPNPVHVAWSAEALAVLTIVTFGGLLVPSFAGSIASLFVRYRRAGSVERAQLRWVFWSAAIPVALLITSWAVPSSVFDAAQSLVVLSYALIPISVAVAVLRYGLYEIDRIISRTASYGIVTVVVLGVYVLVVLAVGTLLPDASAFGVAIATLAAATVFLPLLRWVQRVVDRRFNRAQYDAARVVDGFGERLRNGADPHTATDDLVTAVERTLQPSTIGVWTRPSDADR